MTLKHATAALCGLLAATSALAGNATGKVGQVMVGRLGNQVFIELLATEFSSWPCATTHPSGFRYAFQLNNTETARAILATVLAAQTSGQNLQVIGNGTCSIDSSLEDLSYVVLRP